MVLARLRWLLIKEGAQVEQRLRREGLTLCVQNIATGLLLAAGSAKPRSRLVPWHLDDTTVEKMIGVVARELAAMLKVAA
jgi:hypothetical protein